MPTTANMGMVLPTVGGSSNVWSTLLNACLNDIVDLHDHSSGKGVKVPSNGLKINADVSWSFAGTSYSLTDVKAIDFEPVAPASISSYTGALFANSSDSNNLYWRTTAGSNVQITDGSALAVAAFIGGIGGDYSSVSALLDFDDATDMYRLRQEEDSGVRQYAKLGCADIELREYDAAGDATVPTNAVTIKSPDALAANYSITLPAALPAATAQLSITSAGVVTADGAHGEYVLAIPGCAAISSTGAHTYTTATGAINSTASTTIQFAIPLRQGDRIKSVTVAAFGDAAVDATVINVNVISSAAAVSTIGTTSITNIPASWNDTTINVTDTTLAAGEVVLLVIAVNATGASFNNLRVTYDRP